MINYVSGDILQSMDEYIVQGVAVGSQEGLGTQPDMYHAELSYLNKGLKRLKKLCADRDIKTDAMPKIGAGLGKLDWHTGWRSYRWDVGARLMSMRCSMRGEPVLFDYDSMCNLVRGDYAMHDSIFRTPDKVGNLYREEECRGREYDRGGRLLWDGEYHYRYDCEGNLVMKTRREVHEGKESQHGRKQEKRGWFTLLFSQDNDSPSKGNDDTDGDPFACWQPGDTCYRWHANGMLSGVRTPDGKTVTFGYDALGRRVSKTVGGSVHRFGWDGNVVLHEWDIEEADRPKLVTDETGREEYAGSERTDNLVTWVYDGTSFTPVAKVTDGERYTIVHDYLGTPTQAYDSEGNLVWEMLLDVYGEVMESRGDRSLVPFRYQGQYEDRETGLYYNRFRYYSPEMGMYISSDPIGLAGNNPTLYGYVQDVNTWLDEFGLLTYNTMPTIPDHQKHHIIPQQLRNHDVIAKAGFNIHDESNIKYLPTKAGVNSNSKLPILNGSHPIYTNQVKMDLDRVLVRAAQDARSGNVWNASDYQTEIDSIINKYNNLLDQGLIKCK